MSTCCSRRELSRYERDQSFPEKKGYTPDVKLEYVDEKGRLLSTKEVHEIDCIAESIDVS